jgi:anaerobic ribonucleoside-triphosphate reductase activating protein
MIYLWTGYIIEDFNLTQKKILKYIDILVDGRFEENKKNLSIMLRGSSNQRVIDIKKSLNNNDIVIYEVG